MDLRCFLLFAFQTRGCVIGSSRLAFGSVRLSLNVESLAAPDPGYWPEALATKRMGL
jgi:hypothetical protein